MPTPIDQLTTAHKQTTAKQYRVAMLMVVRKIKSEPKMLLAPGKLLRLGQTALLLAEAGFDTSVFLQEK